MAETPQPPTDTWRAPLLANVARGALWSTVEVVSTRASFARCTRDKKEVLRTYFYFLLLCVVVREMGGTNTSIYTEGLRRGPLTPPYGSAQARFG